MQFSELIARRRSVREYAEASGVGHQQLCALIDTALQAPSWKNTETGRYYIVTDADKMEQVRACLPTSNGLRTQNAAALIVTAFVSGVSGYANGKQSNELGEMWGAYDLGLQNAYLVLGASDMGMDTLIMGLRDADALRKCLSIPEEQTVFSVIALGYRSGSPALRPRRSAEDVCVFY